MMFCFISDAILHINGVLQQINEGIKITNIETYISLSEQIIEEIRGRNFSGQNNSVEQEVEDAMTRKLLEYVGACLNESRSSVTDVCFSIMEKYRR